MEFPGMSAPQRHLSEGLSEGIESLASTHGLQWRRHAEEPDLVGLKYLAHLQRGRSAWSDVARQARGTVLDCSDGEKFRTVCRPFDKFFNYGEPMAAELDWSSALAYEKLDGTLMLRYWARGQWRWATTGSPDARGTVRPSFKRFAEKDHAISDAARDVTYEELASQVLAAQSCGDPIGDEAKAYTFMFELCGPRNRVIVKYDSESMVLLGARHNDTGAELSPEAAAETAGQPYIVARVLSRPRSLSELQRAFGDADPRALEGFVVVDESFRRIKVKHPGYVAMHWMGGDGIMSARRAINVVRSGEGGECIAYFPECAEMFARVSDAYDELVEALEEDLREVEAAHDKRSASVRIAESRIPDCIAAVRAGEVSTPREFLATKMGARELLKCCGIADEKLRRPKRAKRSRRALHPKTPAGSRGSDPSGHWSAGGAGGGGAVEASSAPEPAADDSLPFIARFVHGSEDSTDLDVIYVLPYMPKSGRARAFCDANPLENRNVITLTAKGTVASCFKGLADEVNNAAFRTFDLHSENFELEHGCPIREEVPRDVLAKISECVTSSLGLLIHGRNGAGRDIRREVKRALAARGLLPKLDCLQRIEFGALARAISIDARKQLVFKMAQTVALMAGEELYTKAEIADRWPDLEQFVYRDTDGAKREAEPVLQRIRDVLVEGARPLAAAEEERAGSHRETTARMLPGADISTLPEPDYPLTTVRLGVDIGGVLTAKVASGGRSEEPHGRRGARAGRGGRGRRRDGEAPEREDTIFGDDYLNAPSVPGALEGLKACIELLGVENVWIVSKAGVKVATRSLEWLEHNGFFGPGALDRSNVAFCLTREEKAGICARLGLTALVDDHAGCLAPCASLVKAGKMSQLLLFGGSSEQARSTGPAVTAVSAWEQLPDLLRAGIEARRVEDVSTAAAARSAAPPVPPPSALVRMPSGELPLRFGIDIGGVLLQKSERPRKGDKPRRKGGRRGAGRSGRRHDRHGGGDDDGAAAEGGAGGGEVEDTSFFGGNYLKSPAEDEAVETIAKAVELLGPENVWIVSKASRKVANMSVEWMEANDFFGRTGMLREQLVFCLLRGEKAGLCEKLGITVMIDDHHECLAPMVPLVASRTMRRLLWYKPRPRAVAAATGGAGGAGQSDARGKKDGAAALGEGLASGAVAVVQHWREALSLLTEERERDAKAAAAGK